MTIQTLGAKTYTENEIITSQKKKFLDAMADYYDKAEGTVINDIATANAIANEHFYLEWAKIASSLDYRVAEGNDLSTLSINFGIYRKLSSYATGKITLTGVSGTSIPKGFTVTSDTVEYSLDSIVILDEEGTFRAPITALVEGKTGNTMKNTITKIPISLSGLISVSNEQPLADAQDEETDEILRKRIDDALRHPATSGNANHYFQWASEVSGVGGVRVIVKPSGAGSMRIAIVNANNSTAPAELITAVYEHILDERPATSGVLEVVSATPLDINVTVSGVTIDYSSGLSIEQVLENITINVENYINVFDLDATEVPYVAIVKEVIKAEGVSNYTGLTINGGNVSIPIVGIEIPKANLITATV